MDVYKTLLLTFVFPLALCACQNETGATQVLKTILDNPPPILL